MSQLQDVYQQAIDFAARAHGSQRVPGKSYSYIVHLSNVTMEVLLAHQAVPLERPVYALQCALLHDVLEDTSVTEQELEAGFGEEVMLGVLALTKDTSLPKKEQLVDSVLRIKRQSIEVGIVKLADRITNLQEPPPHWPGAKRTFYLEQAQLIARELGHCHPFLKDRLEAKIRDYRRFLPAPVDLRT